LSPKHNALRDDALGYLKREGLDGGVLRDKAKSNPQLGICGQSKTLFGTLTKDITGRSKLARVQLDDSKEIITADCKDWEPVKAGNRAMVDEFPDGYRRLVGCGLSMPGDRK
jgi:hypothetical protein